MKRASDVPPVVVSAGSMPKVSLTDARSRSVKGLCELMVREYFVPARAAAAFAV